MPSYIVTDDQKPVRIVGSAKGMGGLNVMCIAARPSERVPSRPTGYD